MHQVKKEADPTAFVAANKNRKPIYNKNSKVPSFYLEDGEEFQIELYNPRKYHVLAMIHLNGQPISRSGIVLKPGQRIFLDRHIDKKKKLKFETYEVPNDEQSKEAIEYNGDLTVEFFHEDVKDDKGEKNNVEEQIKELHRELERIRREKKDRGVDPLPPPTKPHPWRPTPWDYWWYDDTTIPIVCTDRYSINGNDLKYRAEPGTDITFTTNGGDSITNASGSVSVNDLSLDDDTIETGRVEEGKTSSQEFESVDMEFMKAPLSVVKYKLYPISQKTKTSEDIVEVKRYCHACGAKKKPKFKFCPYCGEKQD